MVNSALPLTTIAVSSSIFVSPQKDIAFALNVPDDVSSSDLFFSLAFPTHSSWVAVGLGASTMDGNPLVLMAYPSKSGNNVTLSPRQCSGQNEPVYDSSIDVKTLPGTGLFNDTTFIFNGVCGNCRSWSRDGSIDVSSTAQQMIYATGPTGDTQSDDPRNSVEFHSSYGSFTMDLVRATGEGGVPEIPANENVTSVGAVRLSAETGQVDNKAITHAVFMILAFVGIWPFGILVLRIGHSPRWHAINQVVAFGFVVVGAILGFTISLYYNRSKKFNTPHQIIGILVFIFSIGQLVLGFLHHRAYKKTQQPTKMAPVHVWLGRLVILLGIVNGFTGFPLALSPIYDFALLGVVLVVLPIFLLALAAGKIFKKFMKNAKQTDFDHTNGYEMDPWGRRAEPGMHDTLISAPPQGARQFV
ncbi:hypothetical protein RRF57_004697 [Xylaria bambusicola]|uniref:Cytochrome b561 domain-containing protein n=1 Tax=Xylaria bambusicola TaxID=326684 RepID=A0AAN7Z440_9PEZI